MLRFDIKKAKTGYLPRHTKLKTPNGEIAKSKERAYVLADFFEHKQWGKQNTYNEGAGQGQPRANAPQNREHRPQIFDYMSDIRTIEFTIEEIIHVLKKSKNEQIDRPRRHTH